VLEVRETAPDLVEVDGSVDLATVSELREKLGKAVDRAVADGIPILSVDLHAAELADAAGLGVLLGAHRRARRGGSGLRLIRLSPDLSKMLLVSRLYRVLDIGPGGPSADRSAPVESVPAPRGSLRDRPPLASS
jgi:anti-sigma B factor antagonist